MDDKIQATAECAAALHNISIMLMNLGEDMASNVVLSVAKGLMDKNEDKISQEVEEIMTRIESI